MVKRFMWPQARQNFCKLNNKIIFLLYLNLDAQVSSVSILPTFTCFLVTIQYYLVYACTPLSRAHHDLEMFTFFKSYAKVRRIIGLSYAKI